MLKKHPKYKETPKKTYTTSLRIKKHQQNISSPETNPIDGQATRAVFSRVASEHRLGTPLHT
jgi:hypothetical protein